MLKNLTIQANNLIGIDISQKHVCAVELAKSSSNLIVKSCAYDKPLSSIDLAKKPIITGITHKDVYFQEINLSQKLAPTKLEKFLQLNIGKYTRHSSQDLNFDYKIIKEPKKTTSTNIQLVAVTNSIMQQHVSLFKSRGIIHKIIDLNIYALERITRRQLPINHNIIAAVNIDLTQLLIVVINKYKILHTHTEFIENINEYELTTKLINILHNITYKIDQIFLAGQQNIESKILTIIVNKLNLTTKKINPFLGMKIAQNIDHKITPALAISCGLALRVSDACWY